MKAKLETTKNNLTAKNCATLFYIVVGCFSLFQVVLG